MALGTVFVLIFISYYTLYLISLLDKRNRKGIQGKNQSMTILRKIPIKTVEEQKDFINLRYPKKGKFKITWRMVWETLLTIVKFMAMMIFYNYIFTLLKIDIPLWLGLLFVMTFPIIINLILKKFNLQSNDITVFFRGGG